MIDVTDYTRLAHDNFRRALAERDRQYRQALEGWEAADEERRNLRTEVTLLRAQVEGLLDEVRGLRSGREALLADLARFHKGVTDE